MAHRPIPFSTPNRSESAHSPFYRAERKTRGKAISEGIKRAREERAREDEESLAETVVPRRKRS